MTTVAYCSVSPDGRTFRDQLFMRIAEMDRAGGVVCTRRDRNLRDLDRG